MKSTASNEISNSEYPCLKRFTSSSCDFVVLFTESKTGVRIHNFINPKNIGDYKTEWVEDGFIKYNGEITLQN